jgi:hypothetical protein
MISGTKERKLFNQAGLEFENQNNSLVRVPLEVKVKKLYLKENQIFQRQKNNQMPMVQLHL